MTFTPEVYEVIRAGAQRSAARVVPMVIDLFAPKRVIDVGGGEGWWAREFAARGCHAICVDESVPEIGDAEELLAGGGVFWRRHVSLTSPMLADWFSTGDYDLAVCLEVAEHLPPEHAGPLVGALCAVAPYVLFSAAIPGQGGHGHLNEQWPGYWADLFRECGYHVSASLRTDLWDLACDGEVEPWYAQNLLVCCDASRTLTPGHRNKLFGRPDTWPYPLVHPVIWEHRRQRP